MTLLYRRSARVVIDTIELVLDPEHLDQSLDFAFSVERSLKPEPNNAEIQVWNLNPDHRSQLEELDKVGCTVEAGYTEKSAQIFSGTLRTVFTAQEGSDLVTNIQSGDGKKQYQQSRVNISIAKGTPNDTAVEQVVKALGIGVGNLATQKAALAATPALFPAGGVLSGSASQILTRIVQSLGFEWSIQEGALQLLKLKTPLGPTATLLKSDTGLIGSPSVDTKGILTAQTLLIPEIFPGRLLVLESVRLSGNYRVEKCVYSGNTAADDWYIDIEAKKI